MSRGMASRALPYTLQELCFWQSASFPPLWSLQTGRSETLNVPPHSPPNKWGRVGGPLRWGCLHSSYQRFQSSSCPLPVFVCAEYGFQHHPLFFDGSLGEKYGQRDKGDQRTQVPVSSLKPISPSSPVMLQSCLGH